MRGGGSGIPGRVPAGKSAPRAARPPPRGARSGRAEGADGTKGWPSFSMTFRNLPRVGARALEIPAFAPRSGPHPARTPGTHMTRMAPGSNLWYSLASPQKNTYPHPCGIVLRGTLRLRCHIPVIFSSSGACGAADLSQSAPAAPAAPQIEKKNYPAAPAAPHFPLSFPSLARWGPARPGRAGPKVESRNYHFGGGRRVRTTS
eukprot:gene23119-biopygen19313